MCKIYFNNLIIDVTISIWLPYFQVALCDDYSLPVDHVNKKRPNSFAAPSLCEWNVSSPNEEQVSIILTRICKISISNIYVTDKIFK